MTTTGLPEEIYTRIQEAFRATPVVLIGSGFSCGYGLPHMGELGEHLASTVGAKLYSDGAKEVWKSCLGAILLNLEDGLNQIPSGAEGRAEIVATLREMTAQLIIERTHQAEMRILDAGNPDALAPVRLMRKLYGGAPRNADCISVITTNYDTLVELFCDLAGLPIDTGFSGFRRRMPRKDNLFQTYYRRVITVGKKGNEIEHRPALNVRLYKPHGSIAWNTTANGPIEVTNDFSMAPRAIVVPGPSKYEDALINTLFDSVRGEMNSAISKAGSLFCIGFGFNDEHLQGVIKGRLQTHMPTILITRGLTSSIKRIIETHPHVITFEKNEDGCNCHFNGVTTYVPSPLWQLDDFLKTFLE